MRAWLTARDVAATLAPTRETYTQALSVKFPPERVHQVGWPVRDQFYRVEPEQRSALLEQMGLDPQRFTVFLQGGGEGAAQFGRTVERVLAIPQIQVILAAGTNQALITHFGHGRTVKYFCPAIYQRDRTIHGSSRCHYGEGRTQTCSLKP